jgi:DNA damage-binding protein 1
MQDAGYDNLVVLTDHPDPELIFLSYTITQNGTRDVAELKTLHHLSLYERSARPAEFFNDMLLDPSGGVLVASCYAGKLKVVLLEGGSYQNDFDVSWVIFFIVDMYLCVEGCV